MITHDEVYRIGRLGKPHGIGGNIVMHVDDDVFDRVEAEYLVLEIDGILVPFFIDNYRFRNDESAIIALKGVDSEEKARQLTHCDVYFPRILSDDDSEEISLFMLVGFVVKDETTAENIGTITDIDDTTINTLFVLTDKDNNELLLPANDDFITDINQEQKTITMKLPSGLI